MSKMIWQHRHGDGNSLQFEYTQGTDILMIEGIAYSGDLFRAWSEQGIDTGTLFSFERADGGYITISVTDETKVAALRARVAALTDSLDSLETVTRSYLRLPIAGEEPGYDATDVLTYCDQARALLATKGGDATSSPDRATSRE